MNHWFHEKSQSLTNTYSGNKILFTQIDWFKNINSLSFVIYWKTLAKIVSVLSFKALKPENIIDFNTCVDFFTSNNCVDLSFFRLGTSSGLWDHDEAKF